MQNLEAAWIELAAMATSGVATAVMIAVVAIGTYKLRRSRLRHIGPMERTSLVLTVSAAFVGLIIQFGRDRLQFLGVDALERFNTSHAWPIAGTFSRCLFALAALSWIVATDHGLRLRTGPVTSIWASLAVIFLALWVWLGALWF